MVIAGSMAPIGVESEEVEVVVPALIIVDTSENGSVERDVTGSVVLRDIVETCSVTFTLESMEGVGDARSFPGGKDEILKGSVSIPLSVVEIALSLSMASVEFPSETEFVDDKLL